MGTENNIQEEKLLLVAVWDHDSYSQCCCPAVISMISIDLLVLLAFLVFVFACMHLAFLFSCLHAVTLLLFLPGDSSLKDFTAKIQVAEHIYLAYFRQICQ